METALHHGGNRCTRIVCGFTHEFLNSSEFWLSDASQIPTLDPATDEARLARASPLRSTLPAPEQTGREAAAKQPHGLSQRLDRLMQQLEERLDIFRLETRERDSNVCRARRDQSHTVFVEQMDT